MSDGLPDLLDLSDEQIRSEVKTTGLREARQTEGHPTSFRMTVWEVAALLVIRVITTALRPILRHIDPREATGWFLRLHGIYTGVDWRDAPVAAEGYVTLHSVTGGRIRAGTRLLAGEQTFTIIETVRLAAASDETVRIRAVIGGAGGNVAAGTAVTFVDDADRPPDATARLLAKWLTVPGLNADTDDAAGIAAYRRRVMAGYGIRGAASVIDRYRLVALGVDRVSSVAVERTPRGYGSADISFLMRGQLPTDDEVAVMQAAIDHAAIATADVRVRAPRIITVAVVAKVTGTNVVLGDVEAAIQRWWETNIGIGDSVLVQDLYDRAHAGVRNIESIDYDSPADNLRKRAHHWYLPSITVTRESVAT